jgi:hypothetical protein
MQVINATIVLCAWCFALSRQLALTSSLFSLHGYIPALAVFSQWSAGGASTPTGGSAPAANTDVCAHAAAFVYLVSVLVTVIFLCTISMLKWIGDDKEVVLSQLLEADKPPQRCAGAESRQVDSAMTPALACWPRGADSLRWCWAAPTFLWTSTA